MKTRRAEGGTVEADAHPTPRWLESVRVRDWMKPDPVVVRADAPIGVAADLLRTHHVRHLPAVDAAGRLVGIVTDRDLRQVVFDRVVQEALGDTAAALAAFTVRDIMTWGALTVRPGTDLRAAASLMRERRIGALPVVHEGRVVGILSETDVLAALEKFLGDRVTTIRPLRALSIGEPYDYGFPLPGQGDPRTTEGTVD